MWRISLHKGVTLFDLLVTTAVAAMLMALAVPSFTTLMLDARRTTRVNQFITAVHLANAEAHKQRREVVLCKSTDLENCDLSATWGQGWMAFVNDDQDQPPQRDGSEKVLFRQAPVRTGTVQGNRDAFVFRPFGRNSTNGTVTFCDRRGSSHARAAIISYTGRPRASSTRPDGGALHCPH